MFFLILFCFLAFILILNALFFRLSFFFFLCNHFLLFPLFSSTILVTLFSLIFITIPLLCVFFPSVLSHVSLVSFSFPPSYTLPLLPLPCSPFPIFSSLSLNSPSFSHLSLCFPHIFPAFPYLSLIFLPFPQLFSFIYLFFFSYFPTFSSPFFLSVSFRHLFLVHFSSFFHFPFFLHLFLILLFFCTQFSIYPPTRHLSLFTCTLV